MQIKPVSKDLKSIGVQYEFIGFFAQEKLHIFLSMRTRRPIPSFTIKESFVYTCVKALYTGMAI